MVSILREVLSTYRPLLGFSVCGEAHRRKAAPVAHLRGASKFGVCLHNCTMFFHLFYAENALGKREFHFFNACRTVFSGSLI
jgi:hypothetical protein